MYFYWHQVFVGLLEKMMKVATGSLFLSVGKMARMARSDPSSLRALVMACRCHELLNAKTWRARCTDLPENYMRNALIFLAKKGYEPELTFLRKMYAEEPVTRAELQRLLERATKVNEPGEMKVEKGEQQSV